uniref:S-layer protein n=1 Tax=Campylobacter rectus TaxID=203 RepID=O30524_CAMRE|nr:S-layer protein [Campylobacter rectus]
MALTQTQVSQLYVTLFGRVSEGAGNKFWQNSQDIATAATNMLATEAAKEYFGSALTSDEAFIKHIYKNTLNKTEVEDPEGINFWVKALKSGVSRGTVVAELIKAAQDPKNKGASQDLFNNKVALSDYTAGKVEGKGLKAKDLAPFKSVLNKITSNPNSVEAAKPAVDALAGISTDTSVDWHSNPEHPGKAYELTTNTDNATANVFNAPMKHNPGGTDRIMTLQSSDKLTGDYSRHDNTLNVEFGQANADEGDPTSRTPTLTNIQNINIEVTGTVNTLDLRDSNDVEKINIHRITKEAGNKFNVESIGQKLVGMRLANVAKKDIDVKFEHKKGVLSGFEDKSNVFLENVEAKSLSITSDKNTEGYENLNLISKQGVSLNKFEANQLRELTIKGSGELKIADVELNDGANPQFNKVNDGGIKTPGTRGFTKLDASGYTGSLTLDITDIVKEASDPFDSGRKLDTDIIGSKLGDTFYLRGGVGSRTNIDGGAGEDKLVLVSGSIGTGKRADGVTDSKITNIENLEMRAQSGDLSADFDRFDASLKRVLVRTEQMDVAATFTLSNISEKFSKEGVIDIEHSAGDQDKPNNYNTIIKATLKDASGKDDSLTFRTLDANNKDNTFEFQIDAEGVENITVKDDDTESNEMILGKAADHTGKVTLTGGTAGKYFAVNSDIVAKEVDASGQKSDLRLTVRDQAANPGQTIKLGTGNDVLTFKELDGLDGKDTITDAGGNDVVRAIFSKDNALNLKGIEGVHVAALDNINLDVTNTDITKMTLMSREAVKQTDHVESLGYGVYGMGNAAFGGVDISKKTITVKKSNISELNFAGDLDTADDANPANDGDSAQTFNGITLQDNQSKELNVNVSSSLDRIKEGATSYTIGQITAHGVEKFNVKIKDEKDKTTTTTIDNVFGKNITHLKVTGVDKDGKEVATKGSVSLGTVSDGGSFKTMQEVDATNVGGAFTATVTSLGDNSQVKLGNGDNVFSALGSGGNNITITAGNGKNKITGSARNDNIRAGNGGNTIHADRGDNNIKVGNGDDYVTAKDGNNVVEFGNGRDKYEGNLGTNSKNDKIVTSITKTDGAADVKFSTTGLAETTTHHLIASDSETVQAVWEGDVMKNYAVNGHRAMIQGEASTDGDDHYLVGAKYIGNSTNLEDTFNNVAAGTKISGGKGNDSFTITKTQTNMITVEGGEGKDQVSINTKEKMTVKISDGDSVKGSNDVIYGFKTDTALGAKNDVLDLDTTKIKAALGGAAAENIANDIQSWDVGAKGKITFYKDNAGATKTLVNAKNLDSVLKFLAEKLNGTGDTVTFGYDRDGDGKIDSTYVFQDGNKDTVVELAGVGDTATNEAAGLNTVATNGDITIA